MYGARPGVQATGGGALRAEYMHFNPLYTVQVLFVLARVFSIVNLVAGLRLSFATCAGCVGAACSNWV